MCKPRQRRGGVAVRAGPVGRAKGLLLLREQAAMARGKRHDGHLEKEGKSIAQGEKGQVD
jgi:hypothetical protein